MALFIDGNGTRYFNCFYHLDNEKVSGTFYVLTPSSARILSAFYRSITAICAVILLLEIFLPLIIINVSRDSSDEIFGIFFAIDACILIPVALFLSRKKKINIANEKLFIDKKTSYFIYLSIILAPVNYTIMMSWNAIFNSISSYYPLAIGITTIAVAAASFRLYEIRKKW